MLMSAMRLIERHGKTGEQLIQENQIKKFEDVGCGIKRSDGNLLVLSW